MVDESPPLPEFVELPAVAFFVDGVDGPLGSPIWFRYGKILLLCPRYRMVGKKVVTFAWNKTFDF